MVEESREDRISYALDQALHSKPNTKKLSGNEMVHQIFVRFDKDVDFRLNDEEFIDFLKALDPNWKEHIVEIAWEVDTLLDKVKDHIDEVGLTEEGFRRLYSVNSKFDPEEHHKKLETYLKINDDTKAARITAALAEGSRKSRDEKVHEIFDRFDEDYDMVLNADEYGNLLASVDPECDGKPVEEIQDLAADDFERYNDAITDDGLTEVGLRMLIDYKGLDVDKAYLNLLVRQSEKADEELLGL